jgi:hypothetical protein
MRVATFREVPLTWVEALLIYLSLPSALEDHRLVTLYASYSGSYKNEEGEEHILFSAALRAVQSMKEGDKILIVEEEVDESKGDAQHEGLSTGERGKRLSYVYSP